MSTASLKLIPPVQKPNHVRHDPDLDKVLSPAYLQQFFGVSHLQVKNIFFPWLRQSLQGHHVPIGEYFLWLSHTLVEDLSKFSRNQHLLHLEHHCPCQSDCWPISDVPAESRCWTSNMCPAIMVNGVVPTPCCCTLTGKSPITSLHTITVVNGVNSSLTEDTLSVVWLINRSNVNNPGLNFLVAQPCRCVTVATYAVLLKRVGG